MKTLYLITRILTFPGAFMKGFWEHVTCRILKLKATDRRYLRLDDSCGHAAHAPAMTPAKAFLLSWLPYIPQRILGWIFVGASAAPLLIFNMRFPGENPLFILEAVALFLGLGLLCNSFPRWEDARRQWRLFYGGTTPEEDRAAADYAEALLAAFDAVKATAEEDEPEDATEAEAELEAVDVSEAMEEAESEDEPEAQTDNVPVLPDMPEIPRFAGLAGKIIFAPANAYFLAGAWLEKYGIPAILAIATTVAALIARG